MSCGGLIPKFFGAVHLTHKTPVNAVHAQVLLASSWPWAVGCTGQ
jgi:hypothetical protein